MYTSATSFSAWERIDAGNLTGKQNSITATGTTNLLTAPSAAGGQPGTKPMSDFATPASAVKQYEINNSSLTFGQNIKTGLTGGTADNATSNIRAMMGQVQSTSSGLPSGVSAGSTTYWYITRSSGTSHTNGFCWLTDSSQVKTWFGWCDNMSSNSPTFSWREESMPFASNSLLLARSSFNANPSTKPISDFMLSPAAQTANRRLLLAPATKGNAPDMVAAPTVVGTVPTFDGSNIVWKAPSSTALTAHLILNGYPVWVFLDDPNTDMYGSWTPYDPGTYLICAIGGGGNGGSGTSSGTNSYAGGEGGCGGIAISRVTISSADLAELTAWKRRFLRWRTTTGNVTYVYLADPNPAFGQLGITTMQANKGSNGGGTTSSGVGAGGAGALQAVAM
jgi:hypothetical protein